MTTRDATNGEDSLEYLSKKVTVNGQAVTLYSLNGQTWLSSPEEIPEVMARLENTRVLLNDPKGEGASLPPKPTAARYRLRGPKQRPILQQDGVTVEGPSMAEISAAETEIRVGVEALEVVPRSDRPTLPLPRRMETAPEESEPEVKAAPKAASKAAPKAEKVERVAKDKAGPIKPGKKVAKAPAKAAAKAPAAKAKKVTKAPVKKAAVKKTSSKKGK